MDDSALLMPPKQQNELVAVPEVVVDLLLLANFATYALANDDPAVSVDGQPRTATYVPSDRLVVRDTSRRSCARLYSN